MTKRYRETIEEVTGGEAGGDGATAPTSFCWRGRHYRVLSVLGHWREDPGWWRRADGQPVRIEQTDMWRVEADHRNGGAPTRGVYEVVRHGESWRLDRVWD